MDGIKKITGILLLLFAGCQLTAPVAQRLDEPEPFRFASFSQVPASPAPLVGSIFGTPVRTSTVPEELAVSEVDPHLPEVPEVPEEDYLEEILFELEEKATILSIARQEELLSPNQWVKNMALINMLDTGRKPSASSISPEERQRQEQRGRLNLSRDELAKRSNQRLDYVDGSASDWRWMHRGVDQLYAMPTEHRENTVVFLRDKKYRDGNQYETLRANAAILLGREGDPSVRKYLLGLVQSESIPQNIRCAAIEVLGRMPIITAADLLPLLDNVKDREIEMTDRKTGEKTWQRQPGNTDVWEELLMAIAEKMEPWEHVCFLEPFHASAIDIRLKTAKIWRRASLEKRPTGELPEKFLEIAKQRDTSPEIRVELIKTLGAWRLPELFQYLEPDLQSRQMAEVRHAAMLALAGAGCQEAIPIIKDQTKESNPATRAVAAEALRKLGAYDEVFKLANDAHYLVCIEVAGAFSERCTRQTATLAQSYLSNTNAKVQLATVEALRSWSIEESGPLFLQAAKSFHPDVRRRATAMLAEHGVSYSGFDPADRPERQTEQYDELVQVFHESVGVDPRIESAGKERLARSDSAIRQVSAMVPEDYALTEVRRCLDDWSDHEQRPLIQRRLTAHGRRLMPLVDHLLTAENRKIPESLDRVFAEVEPGFREIENLKSADANTRRRAAAELAKSGVIDPPSKVAAQRMLDAATQQTTDVIVLHSLFAALQNDPDSASQLARSLMHSPSPMVRKLACEALGEFGGSDDVALMREALRDPSREVVREALRGIDALLTETANASDSSVVEALLAMLLGNGNDPTLQTDAAATLHRLGRVEGTEALRRFAASPDYRIKTYAAKQISELNDPVFTPILLSFLDDGNATVKSAALKGLPRVAGQDIGRIGLNTHSDISQTQQQIDRWKAWGRDRRE